MAGKRHTSEDEVIHKSQDEEEAKEKTREEQLYEVPSNLQVPNTSDQKKFLQHSTACLFVTIKREVPDAAASQVDKLGTWHFCFIGSNLYKNWRRAMRTNRRT